MKITRFTFSLIIGLSVLATASFGAITLTNSNNITLANSLVSTQTNVINDPDVTGGNVGDLLTYTPSDSNNWLNATYDGDRLFNGNAGPGGTDPGIIYAIVGGMSGTVTLDFGGSESVGSIAIYHGFGNRDNGSYTLRDDAGTLGAWDVDTSGSTNHVGMDLFWLTFDSPVTTNNLFIDYAGTDGYNKAQPSFAAIQVYAIPEPSSVVLTLLGFLCLVPFVRSRKRARN